MRLEAACSDTFARHETFHPRFGWFRKAFVAAADDPNVFHDRRRHGASRRWQEHGPLTAILGYRQPPAR